MSAIPGFSTQKKLQTKLGNLNQDATDDRSQFATLQKNFSDKVSLDATQIGLYKTNAGVLTIAALSVLPRRQLNIIGHGASEGDVIRFAATSSIPGFEARVNLVIDADNVVIAALLPSDPTPGDEVDVLRAVTQRFNDDGTIPVSVTPSPIIYVLDGVDTEVGIDTSVPADSNPLPVQEYGRLVTAAVINCATTPILQSVPQSLINAPAFVSQIEIINTTGVVFAVTIDSSDTFYVGTNGLTRQAIALSNSAALDIVPVQAIDADSGVVAINLFY